MYKDMRKKVLIVLKNPATNSKLEDRLTKLTLEAIAEALEELRTPVFTDQLEEKLRSIREEITINTK